MPSVAKVAQRHNIVKKVNILFSKFTGLTTLESLLPSSKMKTGQRTEDDTVVVSQASGSVKLVTISSTISDIEDQREKNPFYTVHISANGPPQISISSQQLAD